MYLLYASLWKLVSFEYSDFRGRGAGDLTLLGEVWQAADVFSETPIFNLTY
jgi:hypothetical protein